MRRTLIAVASIVAIGLSAWGVLRWLDQHPFRIGALLDLDRTPASVRNVECRSIPTTDVLSTCIFEIDPGEFDALLVGWPLARDMVTGTSYDFDVTGQQVGSSFAVATRFRYEELGLPYLRFKRGGQLSLVTNDARDRAQVSLYVE